MAGDLQGLIADKDFQGLAPADKRAALFGVTRDGDFHDLSDGDTMQFISTMQARGQATRPDLYAPPGVPAPPNPIQQQIQQQAANPTAGLPGGVPGTPPGDAAMLPGKAVLGGAAAALAAPAALTVGKAALQAAPYVAASGAIDYARRNLPLGKYIPPGSEMLPLFLAGGKSIAKGARGIAEKEAAGTAAAEAATAEGRVPVGTFAKEVPTPNPYKFKGAPDAMTPVDSTNVGKIGYEPDSRTMTVEYKNGFVYSYHGVPQEVYKGAQGAESIGSYISRNVKGRYETVRRGSVLLKK